MKSILFSVALGLIASTTAFSAPAPAVSDYEKTNLCVRIIHNESYESVIPGDTFNKKLSACRENGIFTKAPKTPAYNILVPIAGGFLDCKAHIAKSTSGAKTDSFVIDLCSPRYRK